MEHTPRGRFIVFEGVDGSGKTTQLKMLSAYLTKIGIDHITTREPGGSPLAEKIRDIVLSQEMEPLTELYLMFAARVDHIQTVIKPNLAAGKWVLSDRYFLSSCAYQGGGRNINLSLIYSLAEQMLQPDYTVFLDVDPQITKERLAANRDKLDRFDREGIQFFERVRSTFKHCLDYSINGNTKMIDASHSVFSIHEDIVGFIKDDR
jgi:dTMP kinase